MKEREPPADSGGTGTHRQLLLATVGGTMSMSYTARAPWAAPMLAGLRPTGGRTRRPSAHLLRGGWCECWHGTALEVFLFKENTKITFGVSI